MYTAQRYTGLVAVLYTASTSSASDSWASTFLSTHGGLAKVQHELPTVDGCRLRDRHDRHLLALLLRLWLFAAKWGITPRNRRKRFGYACAALGVVLAVMGLASIWASSVPSSRSAEIRLRLCPFGCPAQFRSASSNDHSFLARS